MKGIKSIITAVVVATGLFGVTEQLCFGRTIIAWATPGVGSGTGLCGSYTGYAVYMPTNVWGWSPDTNNTTSFVATDGGGQTNTYVYYAGRLADKGCDQTQVIIPNPPHSTQYRFVIYFTGSVPTTNYPLILTGFQ